jgi:hypothetical protein
MDDWGKFTTAGPATAAARDASGWIDAPAGAEGFTTANMLTGRFDLDPLPDEAGDAREVTADWALWGKDGREPGYRVLRCSKGVFGLADFHRIISRYASGTNERLPQYTVCWIPRGTLTEDDAGQGYLAVGIHELADDDPRRSGGRARTADGRVIEYVRFFSVRYAELAEFAASYTDVIDAVRGYQLPTGPTDPFKVELPTPPDSALTLAPASAPAPASRAALAADVAALLLTLRPVCVLGAEAAEAEDRLGFIELVMSLLPYGLRSTLSASTWASSTAQDLKLRLFFSNARLDDGGRTRYVTWGQPGSLDLSAAGDKAPSLYLAWLRQAGPDAATGLAGLTDPVRFDPADIRKMVASLPEDRPIGDSLQELANNLRHRDRPAVTAGVTRLKRYLVRPPEPAERRLYRQQIVALGLLKDHPEIHANTRASVYRVLLRLGFDSPLRYAGYCEIEDAIDGPPLGTLRSVLLEGKFATFLPWLLTAKAQPEFPDENIMKGLAERGMTSTDLLTDLQRILPEVRAGHRATAYDFTVLYMTRYTANARAELIRRGYLTDALEVIFPGNQKAQQVHLERMLKFIYRDPLKRDQIRDLFAEPGLYPTAPLEIAVKHMAASRMAGRFVEAQAASARLRRLDDTPPSLREIPRDTQRLTRLNRAGFVWGFPKKNLRVLGAIGFALVFTAIIIYVLTARPG